MRLEVINPLAKVQEAKDLIPLTTKSGKIMWVHLDIVKGKHWGSSQPKLTGNSCNIISLDLDNDMTYVASLSSFEEEKFVSQLSPLPHSWWPLGLASSTFCDSMIRHPRDTIANDVRNCCTCLGSYANGQRKAKGGSL